MKGSNNTGLERKSQELVGLKLALKALWRVSQHYQVKRKGNQRCCSFLFFLSQFNTLSSHRFTHGMFRLSDSYKLARNYFISQLWSQVGQCYSGLVYPMTLRSTGIE